MNGEIREVAQRVKGYVRARQLMSNTDPEIISDIAVMPAGAGKPMEFQLCVSDLEELTAHFLGRPCGCVEVSAAEYRRLLEVDEHLSALYAAGVGNWEGYVGPVRR